MAASSFISFSDSTFGGGGLVTRGLSSSSSELVLSVSGLLLSLLLDSDTDRFLCLVGDLRFVLDLDPERDEPEEPENGRKKNTVHEFKTLRSSTATVYIKINLILKPLLMQQHS